MSRTGRASLVFPTVLLECHAAEQRRQARDGGYAVVASPLGECFLVFTRDRLAYLGFPGKEAVPALLQPLQQQWPGARFVPDAEAGRQWAERIFHSQPGEAVTVMVAGTPFQQAVWQALLQVSAGTLTTYGELARQVGKPGASRAVGSAVGSNPVSYLIPCHRVVPASGGLGNYLWGVACKRKLLEREGVTLP